jgi:hypothetical protein
MNMNKMKGGHVYEGWLGMYMSKMNKCNKTNNQDMVPTSCKHQHKTLHD